MKLDAGRAREAIETIARPMRKSTEDTARGMVAISVANMVRAIRSLSVERGHDPRDFVMPFGGAGPMHAHDIAVAMSIREIIVPRSPGIVCAQGLVLAEIKEDFTMTARAEIGAVVPPTLKEVVADLKSRAARWVASEDLTARELRYDLSFDMRYVGQNFELRVPIISGAVLEPDAMPDAAQLKRLFFDAHDVAYSFHDPLARVELLNARLTARAPVVGAVDAPLKASRNVSPRATGMREVYFDDDRPVAAPVYRREDLLAGVQIPGPAVIHQTDTTIPVFPGDRLSVHASGNLIIEVGR